MGVSYGCTNLLLTSGSTTDGSNMITYAADSSVLFGHISHLAAADHEPGTMRKIYDGDTGKYLGEIPEVAHTYRVMGNMNEFQVAIAETTYEGLPLLCKHPSDSIMDYTSLMMIGLQRSKTAREVIMVMVDLATKYGYVSEGESFSVSDKNEVWLFELIGRGESETGVVWVARKVPDGYVTAHANQARIMKFPKDKPEETMYAQDIVQFARDMNLYTGSDADFIFRDAFAPLSVLFARACEGRVWSFFMKLDPEQMIGYLDYIKGDDLKGYMPLFLKPKTKVSLKETITYMRDHFEGTYFDINHDIGAQAFNMSYRFHPLIWKVGDNSYLNERPIGTQQTGWTIVTQSRSWLPDPIGGLVWFGMDDTGSAVHFPLYAGTQNCPYHWCLGQGIGDIMTFNLDSMFWISNMVANFGYSRYNLIQPDIVKKFNELEDNFIYETSVIDVKAFRIWEYKPSAAIQYVSSYSEEKAIWLFEEWKRFFGELFTKFMDGNEKYPAKDPKDPLPIVKWPGYGEWFYGLIVKEAGDKYRIPTAPTILFESHKVQI